MYSTVTVRHRSDQMDVGPWLTTGRPFGYAGDLEPLGDPADPHQIDHHDVDRVPFDHVAERDDAPDVFAARHRRRRRAAVTRASPAKSSAVVTLRARDPDPVS
jgi:hypothetical protein